MHQRTGPARSDCLAQSHQTRPAEGQSRSRFSSMVHQNQMCSFPKIPLFRDGGITSSRSKMLYATSKDRIKHELDGFHYEIQATDPTEMDLKAMSRLNIREVVVGLPNLQSLYRNKEARLMYTIYDFGQTDSGGTRCPKAKKKRCCSMYLA
ncbi:hypothetical protein Lal_00015308 [Lupinus albus]|nr:hypothetical protein Lal_00015308 [Lupinus albus]